MNDLVDRLRKEDPECGLRHSLAMEAADCIEKLETALREIKGWNDNQDRRSLKIAAVIDAALAGEKKDGQAK